MNLISMTDFVFQIEDYKRESHNTERAYNLITNYANFLKQPLKLGMLIPCDENGNVLEEPKFTKESALMDLKIEDKYQQAKERVIFEGFEYEIGKLNNETAIWINSFGGLTISEINKMTIEDLVKYNLKLTDSAIKQVNI